MYHIRAKNVNEALRLGVMLMKNTKRRIAPRGMETIEYDGPVITTYVNPEQRVCTIPERDANPFFHLMEALWILAGRQDVEWLAQFNQQMRKYSDDGKVFHAAYGHRLRKHFGVDQINETIRLLKADPDTRRAVMAIWDPDHDLFFASKDIPCNDLIAFKIRDGFLHMTVMCRSNDMVWGAYGANAVQFSMLQEYIASCVGVKMGRYVQISDSFHVYVNEQWEDMQKIQVHGYDPYRDDIAPFPLFFSSNRKEFTHDLRMFFDAAIPSDHQYTTPFFEYVAKPMLKCWLMHKLGGDGMHAVADIAATDWRLAATQWLSKREEWNDASARQG
jgi:thymidylate synthase (methanogen type)